MSSPSGPLEVLTPHTSTPHTSAQVPSNLVPRTPSDSHAPLSSAKTPLSARFDNSLATSFKPATNAVGYSAFGQTLKPYHHGVNSTNPVITKEELKNMQAELAKNIRAELKK